MSAYKGRYMNSKKRKCNIKIVTSSIVFGEILILVCSLGIRNRPGDIEQGRILYKTSIFNPMVLNHPIVSAISARMIIGIAKEKLENKVDSRNSFAPIIVVIDMINIIVPKIPCPSKGSFRFRMARRPNDRFFAIIINISMHIANESTPMNSKIVLVMILRIFPEDI